MSPDEILSWTMRVMTLAAVALGVKGVFDVRGEVKNLVNRIIWLESQQEKQDERHDENIKRLDHIDSRIQSLWERTRRR